MAAEPARVLNDPVGVGQEREPFLIESSSEYRSEGPYELTSRKYARESTR